MSGNDADNVILIVEDDVFLRDDIAMGFRDAGWDVLEASSGENALVILASAPRIDVVFTDIQLGGKLSGWDVADAVRAERPEIPVVYASGNSADPSRTVHHSLFFAKPYQSTSVIDACHGLA